MTRILAAAMLTLLCVSLAWADGGVFPRVRQVQQGAEVRTPDQRALVRFDEKAGVETLVIETTVKGDGNEFAWVLPLPAVPTIEASTTGLFPTLRALSPVDVWMDATPWWLGVLLVVGAILVSIRHGRVSVGVLAVGLVVATFSVAIVVPQMQGDDLTLGSTLTVGSGLGLPDATRTTVRVLSRETVGAFDTTVLSAKDPADLRRWFDENGYAAPESIDPVIDAYLRDGWVFVASKVRADASATEVRNIHPLAFTFPAKAAVYPMRLTGAVNDTLDLELYVFADRRAEADGLDATHCTAFGLWEPGAPVSTWTKHAEIGRRAGEARGVTRLVGTLGLEAMRRDVTFDWDDLDDERPLLFTRASAASIAGTAAAVVLVIGLVVAVCRMPARAERPHRPEPREFRLAALVVVGMGITGAGTWLVLPTTDAPPGDPYYGLLADWTQARNFALSEGPMSAVAGEIHAGPAFHDAAAARAAMAPLLARLVNPFTGSPVREEDSPGNYLIEERGGSVLATGVDRWGGSETYDLSSFERTAGVTSSATLEGTVRDARGAPLAGARVVVMRASTRAPADTPADVDPRFDVVRDLRETTSGADGRYRVRVPPGFVCDVAVDAPGKPVLERIDVDLRAVGVFALDLFVADGVSVRGRVVNRIGEPVVDAAVHLGPPLQRLLRRPTEFDVSPDGTFEIPGVAVGAPALTVTVHVHHAGAPCPKAEFTMVPGAKPVDLFVDVH